MCHAIVSFVLGAEESPLLSAEHTGPHSSHAEALLCLKLWSQSLNLLSSLGCPVPSWLLTGMTLHTSLLSTNSNPPVWSHRAVLSAETPSSPCLKGRPSDHTSPPCLPSLPPLGLESAYAHVPHLFLFLTAAPTPSLRPCLAQVTPLEAQAPDFPARCSPTTTAAPPVPRCPCSMASLTRERRPRALSESQLDSSIPS